MQIRKIDLYNYFGVPKSEGAKGILTTYVLGRYNYCENRIRPAMLILPGGGYGHCSEREAEPIANAYMVEGFNCYVLEYSCKPFQYPTQFIEATMAMAYIRENAKNDCTDENHVCAIGFSAGGHLCASLATLFDEQIIKDILGTRNVRPDGVILSYPVITSGEKVHKGSFDNLCGGNQELAERLSLENRVDEKSSPAFIWATFEDNLVPFENSLYMASAYAKHNIPVEYHLFEHGGHGLSLATEETLIPFEYVTPWFKLSVRWLKERGFTIKNKE